jgi:hypothetical protein
MRSLLRVLGFVAAVACLMVVGGGGVAVAAPGGFGSIGEGAGQFQEPRGVAVEQESGAVYVADTVNERVDKFAGGGAFLFAWGWGVADGHTQALQACTALCFGGAPGGGAGELHYPEGVAVDNDPLSASYRDVYVVDVGNLRVEKFDSEGHFLLMFGGEVNEATKGDVCLAGEACQAGKSGTEHGEFEGGSGIAVDSAGTVFVGDANRVQEFSPEGVWTGEIALAGAGRVGALAVDAGGGVYVQSEGLSGVRKYNAAGTELGEPRDASGVFQYRSSGVIALGPAGELFVDNVEPIPFAEGHHHILEFDPSGVEVARFDGGTQAEGGEGGIAFGEKLGELYVLSNNRVRVRVVSPPAAGPLVFAQSTSELQPTTAAVNAMVNPEGHASSYHVEYGTSVAYGSSTPPVALGGSGFEDEPVSVALSGLQPRTTYHFRVVASNSAGTIPGADETFTTLAPVSIDSESVSGVTSSSVTLAAQVNPLGRDTHYRFEYGPSTAYGTSVPIPDGDAGSGTVDVSLSVLVAGLSPGATYHYRVVAYNSYNTSGTVVEGSDRTFTTQSAEASGLPDGRAWELVSPPDKHGASLEAINSLSGGLIQAARDGGAVSYVASAPVGAEPRGNRSVAFTQVLSTRGSDGWVSRDITTPEEPPVSGLVGTVTGEYRFFSDDLSVGLVEPYGATPLSAAASERTPYRREANGEYTPLVTAANVPSGTEFGKLTEGVTFLGGTPDLSHVVVSSKRALTPGFVSGGNSSLYQWAGGSLRLISVLPNGKPAAEEGEGAALAAARDQSVSFRHAVSNDGSRVFWTAGITAHLYMRDMRLGQTVQVDVVQEGAKGGNGQSGPVFQTASGDGSKVFFTDGQRLTVGSTAPPGVPDLYMCEIGEAAGKPTCRLTDLTVAENGGEAANVQGVVIGAGEDGRYVYFVAEGVLAPGAAPGGKNLYVDDTVTGERRFIATLASEDAPNWNASQGTIGRLDSLTSRVSPNGRYLAFMSQRSLTGYDNIDASSGLADEEVFLYDVSSRRLVCASCNPSGARPLGVFDALANPGPLVDRGLNAAPVWANHWLAASLPGWTAATAYVAWYQSRYLSDSGRLFFNAADALVPRDTNGREDVYEYEPGGVGGCAVAAGCVGLMSSGTSGEESAFLDASETGDEVFFLTASRLVPQDVDGAFDVYDARVCSAASPCLASPPPPPLPCSSGGSCRAAGAPLPEVFGAPSSTSVSGAGNLVPGAGQPAGGGRRLTRARKLAVALRKCRARPRRRRVVCEARARRLYGSGAGAKRSVSAGATRKGNR